MKRIMAIIKKDDTGTTQSPQDVEKLENSKKRQKTKKIKETKAKLEKKIKIVRPVDEKLKRPKESKNVLLVNPRNYNKKSVAKKLLEVIFELFYEYANITKVNGMYHLRRLVTTGWLRILWSCIMIGLLSFAATLIYLLYRRYLDSPTRTTISVPLSINEIPFPAITICHPQNVMDYKSVEFVRSM